MRVLGYHIADEGAVDSDGDTPQKLSLVEFLLKPKEDTIRIFFDLDFSIYFLLKSLKFTPTGEKSLRNTTRYHLPPYQLRYVVGKFMSIKRSNGFAYYSNASQYVNLHPMSSFRVVSNILALKAKDVGEKVRGILDELGIETTSLTSPARAYEKSQVARLVRELEASSNDEIRRGIIESIGLEVFGRTWEDYKLRR